MMRETRAFNRLAVEIVAETRVAMRHTTIGPAVAVLAFT
jgi:hypothetical protein